MKSLKLVAGCVVAFFAGCSSTPTIPDQAQDKIALAQFSPNNGSGYREIGVFHLGAGDELGRKIFVQYLTYLENNAGEYYTTGQDPSPNNE